jgi:tRNA(fMet)-specific endonuclease VapC
MGNANILLKLAEIETAHIATSVIVRGELINMAEQSQQKTTNLALVHRFLDGIEIHQIDNGVADRYGKLKADIFQQFAPKDKSQRRHFRLQNLGFGENDLWIAATALHHGLTLVSSDRDFTRIGQVCDLNVESWL